MKLFYSTNTWSSQPQPDEDRLELYKFIAQKENWRIVQLPNGYYQTERQDMKDPDMWYDVTRRESIEAAEAAIDQTIEHYSTKVEFAKGPKVVKTFKK
jgi:hypothetical protein